MFGECHAHLLMDARNYKQAAAIHREHVQDAAIHEKLEKYRSCRITFLRDGGDALGVSERAAQLAPAYGIDYRTPVFAIHKRGHYGGIVGRGFDTMKEYHKLVLEVGARGGDFIKVMFSGIMDFAGDGGVTEQPLTRAEIREMIHIAHEEGFAVMAHVNGARPVTDAAELGVDSVEHGNFMDEDSLAALAASRAVWVPTLATISNLRGSGRFDEEVIRRLEERQIQSIQRGYELGVQIALGSDAGAWHVEHGQGLLDEYALLRQALAGVPAGEAGAFSEVPHMANPESDASQVLENGNGEKQGYGGGRHAEASQTFVNGGGEKQGYGGGRHAEASRTFGNGGGERLRLLDDRLAAAEQQIRDRFRR